MKFLSREYQEIKSFITENYQVIIILGVATLSLTLQWYRPIRSSLALSYIVYFIVLPVFVIRLVLKENPLYYGFGLGNYRIWLNYVVITIVISIPVLLIASQFSQVYQYYGKGFDYYEFFSLTVPTLLAWEYLLRGFILFGLKERFGKASIIIQMVPFVLLHLGKPEVETLSCIITGLWFGWIAYRGKSFWPAFLIHIFINFAVKYFVTL
ncbi:MAG: CPBP family intramembrane metalloprotease [Atribacterota bacterium]|nr:CPBP family intramembrane metalloprotease [Atribacterota bacterium]MDD4895844.1 CPBP family intramembrane metalloprotease [Atribacterota bacterium]MDD5636705.1 CPBP family intramembrane metalloprotease [Atribacterota bacterium]